MSIELTIAVIGWGSLIWNPRDLAVAWEWYDDGPMLPVEFARFSSRDRLTLVLVEGAPLQQTLSAVSGKATLEGAAENLRVREDARKRGIGCWPSVPGWGRPNLADEIVRRWAEAKGLEGAVWTALCPTDEHGNRRVASEAERLEYLQRLEREGRATNAREYTVRVPAQIPTPFRELVRRGLGWGRPASLAARVEPAPGS